MTKTNVNFTAYMVLYEPPCEPREFIGFYQTIDLAQEAFNKFAEENNLSKKGICCGNIKHLKIEPIYIQT